MNTWLALSALLLVASLQLAPAADDGAPAGACVARKAVGTDAAPPDFLFASAQEWQRLALEAELDARR